MTVTLHPAAASRSSAPRQYLSMMMFVTPGRTTRFANSDLRSNLPNEPDLESGRTSCAISNYVAHPCGCARRLPLGDLTLRESALSRYPVPR